VSESKIKFDGIIDSLGKAAVNALFPNDFEYYMCAFELVDSDDNSLEYLVLPVMPSMISKSEPSVVSIKKTLAGISIITTSSFIPQDITIKGNFGRKFRILYTHKKGMISRILKVKTLKEFDMAVREFDQSIKTGFGSTKLLQRILNNANKVDSNNKPLRLYFYNLALSESYWVKKIVFNLSQTREQNNMNWEYQIQLKILANLNSLQGVKKQKRGVNLTNDVLQKATNALVGGLISTYSIKIADVNISERLNDLIGR